MKARLSCLAALAALLLCTELLARPKKKVVRVRLRGVHYAGQVNINAAGESQLTQLPFVGPEIARAIARHRQEKGPFASLEELLQVPGIGPKRLARLRPYVKISGTGDFHRSGRSPRPPPCPAVKPSQGGRKEYNREP